MMQGQSNGKFSTGLHPTGPLKDTSLLGPPTQNLTCLHHQTITQLKDKRFNSFCANWKVYMFPNWVKKRQFGYKMQLDLTVI